MKFAFPRHAASASPRVAVPSLAPGKGIVLMVAGSALITINDAVMKWLGSGYPIGQLLFMRGLFAFIPIMLLVWHAGGFGTLRVHRWGGQTVRAGLVVASTYLFITGLTLLPLADAIAIAFAGPLFITALAPSLLGERVGWRRWSAVIVGFAGVLIMVQPTGGALHWAALFPLGAALCGGLRDIVTRRICATESTNAILFMTTAAVALSGLFTLPFGWIRPTPMDLTLMILSGILLGSSHYLIIESLRLAQAAVVAPFKYTSFVWALLLGFVVWGDLPGMWVMLGATLVVGSGLYILHREMRHREAGR